MTSSPRSPPPSASVPARPGLELPDAPAYVVLLIDGLGHRLLERYAHAAPYLSSLVGAPGTAGVPSTTATSLTSLGTALLPGQHGLVGFSARIPGTDRLINHLLWEKSVDPVEWQPHPTAFAGLTERGAHVTAINKREFSGSGLTVAAHRGAEYVGADKVGERIAAAVTASVAEPVADLRLRRRPRLDRPQVRRPLLGLAPAAGDDRRRGRAAARVAAVVGAAAGGRRPRHDRQPRGRARSTSTRPTGCATGWR